MSEVCYPKFTLHVETDFKVNDNGICSAITTVFIDDDTECVSTSEPLDEILDRLLEEYTDIQGYQQLYCIAHEFSRFAELLREAAVRVEDSDESIADLFNLPDV
jgi:hypothetical protein